MTTTYDPRDAAYLDEADVRAELARVFDVCQGCRACTELCSSFPTLFDMLDRLDTPDAGMMTPFQQDRVVAQCHGCKLCVVECPFAPERHDAAVDVPRLMLRARAMANHNGIAEVRSSAPTAVMARTDFVGKLATRTSLANRIVSARSGSIIRKLLSRITGVSATRQLPKFADERFSAWFAHRPDVAVADRHGSVTVFPTCVVEYQEPAVGQDLVKVYERNGIECGVSGAKCCGAPWLYAGDIDRFSRIAGDNVKTLAEEIRAGTDVVVVEPMCSSVLKNDYRVHVAGPDADLVAEHTYDAAEYLMRLHVAGESTLDTDFRCASAGSITYHVSPSLLVQDIGLPSRDLLMLTGAEVTVIRQSAGSETMWGLRAGNEHVAVPLAETLGAAVDRAAGDIVVGDSHFANSAISEQTGLEVRHPLRVMARAYGIAEES